MLRVTTCPTAALVAGPDPLMPPITIATSTETEASAPRPAPTSAVAKRTRRSATPVRSKTLPTRTNIGMAISGYFAMPA
jgi:hypothetical protein